jgi:hypothetical protein
MPRYRTRLLSSDYRFFKPFPYKGLGWSTDLVDPDLDSQKNYREITTSPRGETSEIPAKEIVIDSPSEIHANDALYLISASVELWDAYASWYTLGVNPTLIDIDKPESRPKPFESRYRPYMHSCDLPWACQIAARASRRRNWVYSLTKWKLSAQTYSTPVLALDPIHSANLPKFRHPSYHS